LPRFAFEVVDRHGKSLRGALDAATESYAIEQLMAQGHTPISLRRERTGAAAHGILSPFRSRRFDYAALLRELGTLLAAGLPVERALLVLQSVSADSQAQIKARKMLERIREGEPFSKAFAITLDHAPPHIARLLAAGEASGQLSEVMKRVASGLARTKALKSRLVSDLTYPGVLILAMAVVLWVIFHTVLPRLSPLFSQAGIELPLATQILMTSGAFFDEFGWPLLALVATVTVFFCSALRFPAFRVLFDRWILKSPVALNIPREFQAALFCRNMETMLDGGLPLERALAIAKDGIANLWLRQQIQAARSSVTEGRRLSDALRSCASALPPIVVEFTAVGEETGRLPALMREVAELLDQTVQARLSRFAALVVPVTTLILGALVGGLMAGIVSGILAVNNLAR